MSSPIRRLFVNGFPSLYGGAGTELHHQIIVWRKMGVEVHLIPSWDYHGEPLYNEMVSLGVIMHAPADWSAVQPGDPVLGFAMPASSTPCRKYAGIRNAQFSSTA